MTCIYWIHFTCICLKTQFQAVLLETLALLLTVRCITSLAAIQLIFYRPEWVSFERFFQIYNGASAWCENKTRSAAGLMHLQLQWKRGIGVALTNKHWCLRDATLHYTKLKKDNMGYICTWKPIYIFLGQNTKQDIENNIYYIS